MDKPHRKPRLKSKTSDISKQSPSPLHHTFFLGRARFTAQPLSALFATVDIREKSAHSTKVGALQQNFDVNFRKTERTKFEAELRSHFFAHYFSFCLQSFGILTVNPILTGGLFGVTPR